MIEDFKFSNKDVSIDGENLTLGYSISIDLKPKVSYLSLSDTDFKIKNIKNLRNRFALIFPLSKTNRADTVKKIFPFSLYNINFNMESGGLDLGLNFSFKGSFKGKKIEKIDNLSISGLSLRFDRFKLNHGKLQKKDKDYVFSASELEIRDKALENLTIFLEIVKDKITFSNNWKESAGLEAGFSAVLDFADFKNICLSSDLYNISVADLLQFVTSKDDVVFKGLFTGKINLCFEGGKFSNIDGAFSNNRGGFINVKSEAHFGFLKKRLDKNSYDTLIDNLKNYRYNNGAILLKNEADDLILTMFFESQDLGERKITVDLHDVLSPH